MRHVSTGEIFRQEIARGTLLGRRVQRFVSSGRLVPDALVVQVMAAQVRRLAGRGFVLDGFPRTAGQARGLDHVLRRLRRPLDTALYLTSPVSTLVRRLGGRRVCPRCGAIYHARNKPPRRAGRCDRCGARLTVRKDDRPATIRKRLAVDRKQVRPLLTYYRAQGLLEVVSGRGSVTASFARLARRLRRIGRRRGPRRAS